MLGMLGRSLHESRAKVGIECTANPTTCMMCAKAGTMVAVAGDSIRWGSQADVDMRIDYLCGSDSYPVIEANLSKEHGTVLKVQDACRSLNDVVTGKIPHPGLQACLHELGQNLD